MKNELRKIMSELTSDMVSLYVSIIDADYEASPRAHISANEVYHKVGQLVQTLEDLDDKFPLEKIKQCDVAGMFEGHPINEYVDAAINFATAKKSDEGAEKALREAALKLAAHQQGLGEQPKECTLEDFISELAADIEVEGIYADIFKEGLAKAIKTLETRPGGYSEFYAQTKNGLVSGTLKVRGREVTVEIDGYEYSFHEADDEVLYPEKGCEIMCEGVETEEDPDLIAEVEYINGVYNDSLNNILDKIESRLNSLRSFGDEDLELVRFYLKCLAKNSDEDIDSLSDRALVLAWKQHRYIRNLK